MVNSILLLVIKVGGIGSYIERGSVCMAYGDPFQYPLNKIDVGQSLINNAPVGKNVQDGGECCKGNLIGITL